ncbi:hypothetical protein HS1genome_0725 [Sulfodiicoccus acidiphilus]|uniref:Uncharacterized protein n=1 Tax=Sulfodiicoccus acidiphilus TaxID=1670455 RepID=A0A348B2D4_9CREN|nr:hypothetical protein [Sulfodiicoccus acidiphilus]BBD72336.1 hypothetical protein HS1genome_0725 [Sulfodiicoccus acidiphilus]GGT90189.1 hypothetical protein GCM10007116_04960 [Sulfodiicoccus acidiphilus]
MGPEGRLYRDFRPKFWSIDFPGTLVARVPKVKVDVALEGSKVEAKLKVPPDPIVLDQVLSKRPSRTILLQPLIRGVKVNTTILRGMEKVARSYGMKVIFDDSLTYLSSPRGAVGLLDHRPDVVLRRAEDKWLVFEGRNMDNKLTHWDPSMAKATTLAREVEEILTREQGITVQRVGNVVSVFTSPLVRQYRDLFAVNWKALHRVRLSLLCSGFVTNLPLIFVTHLHRESDAVELGENLIRKVREIKS